MRGLRKYFACALVIGVLAGGVSVVRAAGDDAKVCVKKSGDAAHAEADFVAAKLFGE